MRFRTLSITTSVLTYLTILLGGFVRGSGAGLGCERWPRCTETSFFPTWSDKLSVIEWNHRFVALVAGLAILGTALAAWRAERGDRRILVSATIAAVLLPAQVVLGGLTVQSGLHPTLSALHMGTAAGIFGAVVATAIFAAYPRGQAPVARRPAPGDTGAGQPTAGVVKLSPKATVHDYVAMTKPRIVALLVAMGFTGIAIAPHGLELSTTQMLFTLVGGALSAGAGGVINQVIERDLDARMDRTRDRAVASGRVPPASALAFGLVLAAVSFTMLALLVNVLAAVLTTLGLVFYIFIYTIWLKPATPQGVVIGGAAGAAPALVGWAAVTGDIGLPALLLGGLVFLWTPPHFWALSLLHQREYAQAGFPMMPLVRGIAATQRQMILYALATVITASLFYVLGYLGTFYLAASAGLGAVFLWLTLRVGQRADDGRARVLFVFSIAYLFLLFVAMVGDRVLVAA